MSKQDEQAAAGRRGDATPDPGPCVAFADVLRFLRGMPGPCAPPVGVGDFDVLYASPREVVVWYAPAREGQSAREVAIPCQPLEAAWGALRDSQTLDEPTLCQFAGGVAGGRWLLVILAQLPQAQAHVTDDGALTLVWGPEHPDAQQEELAPIPVSRDDNLPPILAPAAIPTNAQGDAR